MKRSLTPRNRIQRTTKLLSVLTCGLIVSGVGLGFGLPVRASVTTGVANAVVGQYGADGLATLLKGAGTFSGTTNAGSPNVTNQGFGNIIAQQATYSKPVIDETAHRLYVADSANNRIVWYNLTSGNVLIDATQDGVIGQVDGFSSNPNRGSLTANVNGLLNPSSVAVDGANHVWVADTKNNRVLRYSAPIGDGSDQADMVLGQADYNSNSANRGGTAGATTLSNPTDVYAAGTTVWIVDNANNRVVAFASPTGNGSDAASKVIGQPNFTTGTAGITAGKFNTPVGVTLIGTDVWVADRANNRVVRYAAPVGDGTDVATVVLGQANFTTNNRTRPAQNTFNAPAYLAYDATAQRLYVSEYSGHRVTGWDLPTSGDGSTETADALLGQTGYTAGINGGGSANSSQPETAATLSFPNGLAWVAGTSTLYAFDSGNARVLSYAAPTGIGQAAAQQIGQSDFTSHFTNGDHRSISTLQGGLEIDRTRHLLYVSDNSDHRILMYQLTAENRLADSDPDGVIGQPNFGSNYRNRGGTPAANSLGSPSGLQVDAVGNLWVVDNLNSRVLRFPVPVGDGTDAADKVIGQADLTSGGLNRGGTPAANSLRNPTYLDFDASNNLWIVDFGNNRIVRYSTLVGNGTDAADKVLGQANFTSNAANRGGSTAANTLNLPESIAFDAGGHAWVTDAFNHRAIRYGSLVGDGTDAADMVIGQANFTSGSANRGGSVAGNTLANPTILAFDTTGALWIQDEANSRMLRYGTVVGDGTDVPNKVIGQADLTSGGQNRGRNYAAADSLSIPYGLVIQPEGFWVGERLNHRVTFFAADPTVPGTPTTTTPTTDTTPAFTWSASSNVDHYEVQWSTDTTFASGVTTATSATADCSLSTTVCGGPTGLAVGTWFVRVRAVDAEGTASAYSATGTVQIDAVPSPSPTPSPTASPSPSPTTSPSPTGNAVLDGVANSTALPNGLAKSGPGLILYFATVALLSAGYLGWRQYRRSH